MNLQAVNTSPLTGPRAAPGPATALANAI